MNNTSKQKFGFSLIELLIAIIIFGILTTLATTSYNKYITKTLLINSLRLMEQKKPIITNYFSKYKTCPLSNLSEISTRINAANYFGTEIYNDNCNLILKKDSIIILTFQAAFSGNNIALQNGITYSCVINSGASSATGIDLASYLPMCS